MCYSEVVREPALHSDFRKPYLEMSVKVEGREEGGVFGPIVFLGQHSCIRMQK